MGEKLLVRVLVPETHAVREFLVPIDLTVAEGARLMACLLFAPEPPGGDATDGPLLMYREGPQAGELVHPHETFRSLMVQELLLPGSTVVLL